MKTAIAHTPIHVRGQSPACLKREWDPDRPCGAARHRKQYDTLAAGIHEHLDMSFIYRQLEGFELRDTPVKPLT
jgi:hypothetical protein